MTEVWLSSDVEEVVHQCECEEVYKVHKEVREKKCSQKIVSFRDSIEHSCRDRLSVRNNLSQVSGEEVDDKLLPVDCDDQVDCHVG
jgi:hypothetical protein